MQEFLKSSSAFLSNFGQTFLFQRAVNGCSKQVYPMLVGFVIAFSSMLSPSLAIAREDQPGPYSLVMSENDDVCRPLTKVYNKLYSEDLRSDPRLPTNFEARSPQSFSKSGFRLPPKVPGNHGYTEYSVRLLPGADKRTVVVYKTYLGLGSIDHIDLLNGDQYDFSANGASPIEEVTDEHLGIESLMASQKEMQGGQSEYFFTKWPNFQKLYDVYFSKTVPAMKRGEKSAVGVWGPPGISDSSGAIGAQIFQNGSETYFVADQFLLPPLIEKGESFIDVYKITEAGHHDICYIALLRNSPNKWNEIIEGATKLQQ